MALVLEDEVPVSMDTGPFAATGLFVRASVVLIVVRTYWYNITNDGRKGNHGHSPTN